MNGTVRKWGNSLALRIPKSLARAVHLRQGSLVQVIVVDGAVVVKPKGESKSSLSRMLSGITRKNRHSELAWGGAAGFEEA